jgi:hypothetical protein
MIINNAREGGRPVKKFVHKGVNRGSVIESHGPEGKVRGTMQQLVDRYTSLGRDAMREGETVMAEGFFQHAEHYRRLSSSARRHDGPAQDNATPQKEGGDQSYSDSDDEDNTLELHTEDE